MLSHEAVWAAIDALAAKHNLTPSALARRSNLDPTSFNKSKRTTAAGRQRWPSTESLAKALRATNTSIDEFMTLVQQDGGKAAPAPASPAAGYAAYRTPPRHVPLLGFAQAGVGGFFDDGGFPAGQGWDEIPFPMPDREGVYALKVTGDSMLPLYRDGDIIIVSPGATVHKGDRVVVRTREGEVMAKVLSRKSPDAIELKSLNPEHPDRKLAMDQVDWIARILWASQ